jgi:hypothetical protein
MERLSAELDEITLPISRAEVPAEELPAAVRRALAKLDRLERLLAGCPEKMPRRDKSLRYVRRWRAALMPCWLLDELRARVEDGLPAAEVKALFDGYAADLARLEIDAETRATWLRHGEEIRPLVETKGVVG